MTDKHNIEFKAWNHDSEKAIAICSRLGASKINDIEQNDKYFHVNNGYLKIRDDQGFGKQLIYYERLSSPRARSSHYRKIDVSSFDGEFSALLEKALNVRTVVKKHRITYETEYALINIDRLDNIGSFIEVEVLVEKTKSIEKANLIAEDLKTALGIKDSDLVSFSYSELILMNEKAELWRSKIKNCAHSGKLFLLDGCSCSGKTTLTHRVFEENSHDLIFIPRYCTREKRKNERTEAEYIFVKQEKFRNLASNGDFIEYRDFDFGMSYGLSWADSLNPVLDGKNAIGLINLGHIVHVKNILPEAVTILINAPVETIRKRLQDRGLNTAEQIEERVGNAKTVASFKDSYDYIINNDDGMLEGSIEQLEAIIEKEIKK